MPGPQELKFDPATGNKLMVMAVHPTLSKVAYRPRLPSWAKVYKLKEHGRQTVRPVNGHSARRIAQEQQQPQQYSAMGLPLPVRKTGDRGRLGAAVRAYAKLRLRPRHGEQTADRTRQTLIARGVIENIELNPAGLRSVYLDLDPVDQRRIVLWKRGVTKCGRLF
jgi:hypothetical protein